MWYLECKPGLCAFREASTLPSTFPGPEEKAPQGRNLRFFFMWYPNKISLPRMDEDAVAVGGDEDLMWHEVGFHVLVVYTLMPI